MSASRARGPAKGRKHPSEAAAGLQDGSRPANGLSANQLLTAAQLAERWQVEKAHVYRLAREGGLPAVKLGRYFRFRIDAIEQWERDGGTSSTG